MKRIQDATAVYAQSSDIKSRTYLEYRKDMKKKAIAEKSAPATLKKYRKQICEPQAIFLRMRKRSIFYLR